MPLYWIVLLFAFCVYCIVNSLSDIPSANSVTTLLSNLFILGGSNSFLFVIPAWSLDIEVQFYLIAPLLIYLTRYFSSILLLFASIVISVLLLLIFNPSSGLINNVFFYLPFFIMGGILYLKNLIFDQKTAISGIIVMAIILVFNYSISELRSDYFLNQNAKFLGFNYSEVVNIVLAIFTIPLISINVKQRITKKNENLMSSMSYVIYLLHWPLLLIYGKLVSGLSTVEKLLPLLLFYSVSIAMSYVISRTLDNFFEKKRKSWFKDKKLLVPAIIRPEKVSNI